MDPDPIIVLSRSPTVDTILQYLSPGDVARLQCTCKIISDALIAWKRAAYNVNRFLERFFKDPVTFRVLQAQTNLLVSGSSALQFMDRIFYKDSDLDLYVSSSRTREVATFLMTQNYEFFPGDRAGVSTDLESLLANLEMEGTNQGDLLTYYPGWTNVSPYNESCIHGVLCFRQCEDATLVVQIIAIHDHLPPICSIMGFHSTVVFNYITWCKAVSLYPCATFEQRRSLILSENRRFAAAQAKYLARGFTFQGTLTPDEAKSPGPFQAGPRYVGDTRTWILNLETESIPSASVPASRRVYDPETVHSWDLTNLQYSDQLSSTPPINILNGKIERDMPIIYFSLLKDENLEHRYVVHREFHRLVSEVCLGSSQAGATPTTSSTPRGDASLSKLDGKLIECLPLFAKWVNEVRSKMAAHTNHEYCWWKL